MFQAVHFAVFFSNVDVFICDVCFVIICSSSLLLFVSETLCFVIEAFYGSLPKHAYSNILKILPPKNENSQIKILIFFHISAQNIDCWYLLKPPRQSGFNAHPQSMFLSRNKKNDVHHCKPQFYYIKVGLKGVKLYRHLFHDDIHSYFTT